MTRFVNIEYAKDHPGVVRVESVIESAQHIGRGLSGKRGLATLLLSAMAAAVMVVAYEVMDSVAEGHLLVMWIALWAAAFVALPCSRYRHVIWRRGSRSGSTTGRVRWPKPAPTNACGPP